MKMTAVQLLITSTKCEARNYQDKEEENAPFRSHAFSNTASNTASVEWIRRLESPDQRCNLCNCFTALEMTITIPNVFSRSFPKESAVALHGFRIVERTPDLKHIEFKVVVSTARHTYQAWRSYDDFGLLAKRCGVFEQRHMTRAARKFKLMRDIKVKSCSTRSGARNQKQTPFFIFLLSQFFSAEVFLRELLFSIDSLSSLKTFAADASWRPNGLRPCACGCPHRNLKHFQGRISKLEYCGITAFDAVSPTQIIG